jgi:hypothetical protein
VVGARLNRLLAGWAEYFQFGYTPQGLSGRQAACSPSGAAVSPAAAQTAKGNQPLRIPGGVWQGRYPRPPSGAPEKNPRMPFVKPVREPDAGNPHVRFDERRRETERWPRLRHRRQGESRRKQRLPRPTVTAPAADSTDPAPPQGSLSDWVEASEVYGGAGPSVGGWRGLGLAPTFSPPDP